VSTLEVEFEMDTRLGLISPCRRRRVQSRPFLGVEGLAGMHPIEQPLSHPRPPAKGSLPSTGRPTTR